MSLLVLLVLPLLFAWLGLFAASIVWVWRDANRRGQPGWIVALLVALIYWPISLLVWLLLRDRMGKPATAPAPAPAAAPAGACPQCGTALAAGVRGLCPACLLRQGFATGTIPAVPDRDQPAPLPADIAPLFPNLEIAELLGQGGMGAVYKARQPALDRWVALKVLTPAAGRDPDFAERFSREARALARLHHPGIVGVHEFGDVQGRYYFIMEYVDGANLRRLEQERRMAPRDALSVAAQVCDALQYAHDEGIVHRDIKPENILIDRKGRVKIADFGLAKLLGREAGGQTLTVAGQYMGTPHYMAPEQVEHPKDVDHRADIYSLGVVLYEMLTGELPLGRFPAPSQRVEIDVRLDEVVLRTLEKEPARRYQQAGEVKTQVDTIAGTQTGGQRSELGAQASALDGTVPQPTPPPAVPAPATVAAGVARLSRLAVIGACWAPLLLMFIAMFWSHRVLEGEYHGPTWWQQLLAFTLVPLGLAAPFGTTILGWVAVAQIRHSAGRLYGLRLALFDGLLYPLLILDGAILWIGHTGMQAYLLFCARSQPALPEVQTAIVDNRHMLAKAGVLLLVALVDVFIVRAAWRSACKPVNQSASPSPVSTGLSKDGAAAGKWALGLCLAGVVIPLLAGLLLPSFGMLMSWAVILGLFICLESAALVLGIRGWRSGVGKAVVIIVMLLAALSVPIGISTLLVVRYRTVREMSRQNMEQARRQVEQQLNAAAMAERERRAGAEQNEPSALRAVSRPE